MMAFNKIKQSFHNNGVLEYQLWKTSGKKTGSMNSLPNTNCTHPIIILMLSEKTESLFSTSYQLRYPALLMFLSVEPSLL